MFDTETLQEIDAIKNTSPRYSFADLAEKYYGDRKLGTSLRSALRKHRQQMSHTILEPEVQAFDDLLHIPPNNTLIVGDIHAPYQNKVLLEQAIELAKAAN